jgi:F-box interacting protein
MASIVPTERQSNDESSNVPMVNATSDDGLLPTDVLRDILLRLPIKPLCRLHAVCRSWRSLLSDSSFIAAHDARQQPLVAVCTQEPWPILGYMVKAEDVHIQDTSGQLVRQMGVENCTPGNNSNVACTNLDLLCVEGADMRLRVLDPATGVVSLLPHVINVDGDGERYEYGRYFTMYVVGRNDSTGETKVLAIVREYGADSCCKVLTLGDARGWRETGMPPTHVYLISQYTAHVKGVLFFVGSQGIAAYDLEKDTWRKDLLQLALPKPINYLGSLFLAELSDSLVACYHGNDQEDQTCPNDASMDLWILADSDKVIWSKQCTITMPQQASTNPGDLTSLHPLWSLDDGRIVFWVWKRYGLETVEFIQVYDPATRTHTDGIQIPTGYTFHAVYKGSLLRSTIDMKLRMYPVTV